MERQVDSLRNRQRYMLEMWISVYAVCGVMAFLSRGFIIYALVPGAICGLMFLYHKKGSPLRDKVFSTVYIAVGGGVLTYILFLAFPANQSIISFFGIVLASYLGVRVYMLYAPLLKKQSEQ